MGPTLLLDQFHFDIFISGIVIESSQVFAGFIGYFIIYKVRRRWLGIGTYSIIFFCSFVLMFIWDQDVVKITDISSNILTLVFIFIV